MNTDVKKVLKTWAALRSAGRLPPDLCFESSDIAASYELQKRVLAVALQEKERQAKVDAMLRATQEKEAPLRAIVDTVLEEATQSARRTSAIPDLWVGYFGAIGIDPSHLFIFFVIPTDSQLEHLLQGPLPSLFRGHLVESLARAHYPLDNFDATQSITFHSQERCDRNADGNWYYYFK